MARANLATEAWGEARREQGDVVQGTHPALETTGAEGRRRPRRRMGRLQSHAPQSGAGLDAGLPGALEGRGLGLVALEPAGRLGRARQPARRRRIREFPRPQSRPRDAYAIAARVAPKVPSVPFTRLAATPSSDRPARLLKWGNPAAVARSVAAAVSG